MNKILSNKIKCLKCNEIIESKHIHDYVECECKNVAVDGGLFYLKRSYKDRHDYQELSETVDAKLLDRNCNVGEYVYWKQVNGIEFVGKLEEWDSNVAVVKLVNGKTKIVEC